MVNFIVAVLTNWRRVGQQTIQSQPRPHVVPITPEAIAFMEAYTNSDRKACDTIYGGFIDAISAVEHNGKLVLAFRFVKLADEEHKLALELAEKALTDTR